MLEPFSKYNVNVTSLAGISSKLKSDAKSFNSAVVTLKNISRNVCGVGNPDIVGNTGNWVIDCSIFPICGKPVILSIFGNPGNGGNSDMLGNNGNVIWPEVKISDHKFHKTPISY